MKNLLFFILAILIFHSCKKENIIIIDPLELEEKPSDYLPMEVGNYWIYETFQVEENGDEFSVDLDTMTIIRDTLIGADRFFIFHHTSQGSFTFTHLLPQFLGLKNDHVVNADGTTFLSLRHNDTLQVASFGILEDLEIITMMSTENNKFIEVPAGDFETEIIDKQIWVTGPQVTEPFIQHEYYKKNVGIIWKEIVFLSIDNNNITGRVGFVLKLKEYHLN